MRNVLIAVTTVAMMATCPPQNRRLRDVRLLMMRLLDLDWPTGFARNALIYLARMLARLAILNMWGGGGGAKKKARGPKKFSPFFWGGGGGPPPLKITGFPRKKKNEIDATAKANAEKARNEGPGGCIFKGERGSITF